MSIDGTYSVCITKEQDGSVMRRYGRMRLYVDRDNGQLKGSMFPRFFWLDCPFRGGRVEGNMFSFTCYFNSPCQQFAMDVRGTVEGDRISGTVRDPGGDAVFEGVRQAPDGR